MVGLQILTSNSAQYTQDTKKDTRSRVYGPGKHTWTVSRDFKHRAPASKIAWIQKKKAMTTAENYYWDKWIRFEILIDSE